MILTEYNNKRYTLETLSKYLIDNKYSEFFVETVVLNNTSLKLFLKECLKNGYEIDCIEVFKKENINNYHIGFKFKNIDSVTLLEKYPYLRDNDGSFIFLLENYHYSKDVYNYDTSNPPFIKNASE